MLAARRGILLLKRSSHVIAVRRRDDTHRQTKESQMIASGWQRDGSLELEGASVIAVAKNIGLACRSDYDVTLPDTIICDSLVCRCVSSRRLTAIT